MHRFTRGTTIGMDHADRACAPADAACRRVLGRAQCGHRGKNAAHQEMPTMPLGDHKDSRTQQPENTAGEVRAASPAAQSAAGEIVSAGPAPNASGAGRVSPKSLYVVATPLGHLDDITLRAIATLRGVDVIAAEDTRTSATLLRHHGIATRTFAAHQHNEAAAAARIVALLHEGKSVALISDAGTPAVSDPGARIVRAVRDAGFAVVPVPGANALTAALSASGFEGPFHFAGFLSPKRGARVACAVIRRS